MKNSEALSIVMDVLEYSKDIDHARQLMPQEFTPAAYAKRERKIYIQGLRKKGMPTPEIAKHVRHRFDVSIRTAYNDLEGLKK